MLIEQLTWGETMITRNQILAIYRAVFSTRVLLQMSEIIPIPIKNKQKLLKQYDLIKTHYTAANARISTTPHKQPHDSSQQTPSPTNTKSPTLQFSNFSLSEITDIMKSIAIINTITESAFQTDAITKQIMTLTKNLDVTISNQLYEKQVKLTLFIQTMNRITRLASETKEELHSQETDFFIQKAPSLLLNLILNIADYIRATNPSESNTKPAPFPSAHQSSAIMPAAVSPTPPTTSFITNRSLNPLSLPNARPTPIISWHQLLFGDHIDNLRNILETIFIVATNLENLNNCILTRQFHTAENDIVKYLQLTKQSLSEACICIDQREENALPVFNIIWNGYFRLHLSTHLTNGLLKTHQSLNTMTDIAKPNIPTILSFFNFLTDQLIEEENTTPYLFIQLIAKFPNSIPLPTLSMPSPQTTCTPIPFTENPLENLIAAAAPYQKENTSFPNNTGAIKRILQFWTAPFLPHLSQCAIFPLIQFWREQLITKVTFLLTIGDLVSADKVSKELLHNEPFLHLIKECKNVSSEPQINLIYDFYCLMFGQHDLDAQIASSANTPNHLEFDVCILQIQNDVLSCCADLQSQYLPSIQEITTPLLPINSTPSSSDSSSSPSSSDVGDTSSFTAPVEPETSESLSFLQSWSEQIQQGITSTMTKYNTYLNPAPAPSSSTRLAKQPVALNYYISQMLQLNDFLNDLAFIRIININQPHLTMSHKATQAINALMLRISSALESLINHVLKLLEQQFANSEIQGHLKTESILESLRKELLQLNQQPSTQEESSQIKQKQTKLSTEIETRVLSLGQRSPNSSTPQTNSNPAEILAPYNKLIRTWQETDSNFTLFLIQQYNLAIADLHRENTQDTASTTLSSSSSLSSSYSISSAAALPSVKTKTPPDDIKKIIALLEIIIPHITDANTRTTRIDLIRVEETLNVLLRMAQSPQNKNAAIEQIASDLLDKFYSLLPKGHELLPKPSTDSTVPTSSTTLSSSSSSLPTQTSSSLSSGSYATPALNKSSSRTEEDMRQELIPSREQMKLRKFRQPIAITSPLTSPLPPLPSSVKTPSQRTHSVLFPSPLSSTNLPLSTTSSPPVSSPSPLASSIQNMISSTTASSNSSQTSSSNSSLDSQLPTVSVDAS